MKPTEDDSEGMDGKLMRKRKFTKINQRTRDIRVCSTDVWYNFHHWHLFNEGEIKTEIERVESTRLLIRLYERILKQAQHFSKPYQSWIFIEDRLENCHYDAIFFHSVNPKDNFPDHFEYVIWDVPVPDRWKDIFDLDLYRFGKIEFDGEIKYYLIRREFCGKQ